MSESTRAARPAQDRASRRDFIAWLALAVTVGAVTVLYLALSLSASADPLIMPLDDTYIHFQYARQWARGEPMVYNPGDPATSGGTSLLYPLLLALGYLLGFSGWSLAYWALGIGALCFFGAAWLVYRIARANPFVPDSPDRTDYALGLALTFALSGPFIWAALSGMETALFVFAVLLAFHAIQQDRLRQAIPVALLVVLVRPEGLILAGIGMIALALRVPWPAGRFGRVRRAGLLALPLLAGLIQPALNVVATGSATSSGMVAKSHLTNGGASLNQRLTKIAGYFARMWGQLFTGQDQDHNKYIPILLASMAFLALIYGAVVAWRNRRLNAAVIILAWLLALSAALSTLDTAFWQFKRYQLPLLALLFPAAAWGCALVGRILAEYSGRHWTRWIIPAIIGIASTLTALDFARNYAVNVAVVRDQQVPMARWVRDHLPEDARVGAHDVGLVRYFGDRALYDVVGLTTPGPAASWRQGPGAIFEHMAHSDYRPDYFAIYPDVQGLRYLIDAGIFGDVLAEFPVTLPEHNVASAADYQAVYRADWSGTRAEEQIAQPSTLSYAEGFTLVDQLDVANLDSETDHDYRWWQDSAPPGFVTEVYRHVYRACGLPDETACWAADGGRVITGGEAFTLRTRPGEDLLLVTRVHGRTSVPLTIYVNGEHIAQRVQPAVPGRWLEVVTLIPAARVTGDRTRIRIEAQIADAHKDGYSPYYHWAYQGTFVPQPMTSVNILGEFGSDHGLLLLRAEVTLEPSQCVVDVEWFGESMQAGDGIVFVHLYNQDNLDAEPVAQVVTRPAGDTLPPGNWLRGALRDTYRVPLPDDLPPGNYSVAIGFFDARSGERYPVTSRWADADRLFIGSITVEESSP